MGYRLTMDEANRGTHAPQRIDVRRRIADEAIITGRHDAELAMAVAASRT
jgi:hypothetical protein